MQRAWRTLTAAGLAAALAASGAVADDPPKDEPPVQAEKPPEAPGFPWAYPAQPGVAAVPVLAPAPAAVVAAPAWVGDYRVGHIHEGKLDHILWYSAYHPFLDELHAPIRSTVYNGAHARYYAGYRYLYTPNWNTWYVPQSQCYAPGGYGYDPNGTAGPNRAPEAAPAAGDAAARNAYYGPGYYGAAYPGGAYPVPGPAGFNVNGFRYTGEPSVYSPFGVGASSYFGAYGSAGQ